MKRILFQQKKLTQIILIIFLLTFYSNISTVSAQTINNIDNYIANAKAGETQQLEKLVHDLNSTIYLSQGKLNTYGTGLPVVLETGSENFDMLYENNSLFNRIKLIKIKLNTSSDLQESLILSQLESFYNLDYVYVVYTFDACGGQSEGCLTTQTLQLVQVSESSVKVLYKLSIPN